MLAAQDKKAFKSLIGRSPSIEAVIRTAQIAAATDVHILIEGETGTGKELLAQEIQSSSARADQAFIIVNCAALPVELVESLLFGHESGAFTGAQERREGYVQRAHQGTLFLDEIGELPLSILAKLLRFIEHGESQRLGSAEVEYVDVRIIAATNRNLMKMVDSGHFRKDLFYRLNIVPMLLPPLRQRKRDIAELAEHFLQQAATRTRATPPKLTQEALELLKKYHCKATLYLVVDRFERDWSVDRKAHHDDGELEQEAKLSDEQVETLIESGCIELGSHGMTHANFMKLSTDEVMHELQASKRSLEERFNVDIKSFAFPFGLYTAEQVGLVKQAGYQSAVTTVEGIEALQDAKRLELKRIKISGKDNWLAFLVRMRSGRRGWK